MHRSGKILSISGSQLTIAVLTAFYVALECNLHRFPVPVQYAVAGLEVAAVLSFFLFSRRNGIILFFLFSLLGLGELYNISDLEIISFCNLRLGPISCNVFLLFLLALFCLNRGIITIFTSNKLIVFLLCFLGISMGVGLINLFTGENIASNYFTDLQLLLPLIPAWLLIDNLKREDLEFMLRCLLFGTLLMYICNIAFDVVREYGGQEYLRENAVSFYFFPLLVFMAFARLLSKWKALIVLAIYLFLLSSSYIPLMGKQVVILFLVVPFCLLSLLPGQAKLKVGVIVLALVCLPLLILLGEFVADLFWELNPDNVTRYKINQLLRLHERQISIERAAEQDMGSMGNLVAEFFTIIANNNQQPVYWPLGRGLGGAMHDTYEVLVRMAGKGGYPEAAADVDAYLKPHLPFLYILLKGGFLGALFYLLCLKKLFFSRSLFFCLAGIVFFFRFMMSKEQIYFFLLLIAYGVLAEQYHQLRNSGKARPLPSRSSAPLPEQSPQESPAPEQRIDRETPSEVIHLPPATTPEQQPEGSL